MHNQNTTWIVNFITMRNKRNNVDMSKERDYTAIVRYPSGRLQVNYVSIQTEKSKTASKHCLKRLYKSRRKNTVVHEDEMSLKFKAMFVFVEMLTITLLNFLINT